MAINANLPPDLWPEAYKTAIYLGNITPRKSLGWKTPYKVVTSKKPMLAHLYPFGCKAYALNHDIPKQKKLQPRALIGYFIGYDSTNIFRIWIPSRNKVIRTRDVQFDYNLFYDPYDIDIGYAIQERAEILVETLQAVDMQIEGDLDDSTLDTIIVDVPFAPISLANQDTQNEDSANQEAQGSRDSCSDKEHIQLLTPATTNAPPSTTTLTNGQNSPIEEETHGPS